jgi:hypothetical protein
MAEVTLITIIFRSLAIIIGLLMAFFSYKIYRNTQGASRGWVYMVAFGISLFLWSSTAMFFKVIVNDFVIRAITGSIFLFSLAYLVPLSYTYLVKDFNFNRPNWLTPRFVIFFVTSVLILLFAINIFDNLLTGLFLNKLLSIIHLTLAISVLFSAIPTYCLMKATKKAPWILAFLFSLIIGLGLNLGAYYDNNCWGNSEFGGPLVKTADKSCVGYDLDYVQVYQLPASPAIAAVGKVYQLFLLLGLILGDLSFFILWRRLRI